MKRVILLMFCLLLAPAFVSAQMTLNVGAGVTSATLVGSDADPGTGEEKGSRIGIFAGANLAIAVGTSAAVSPGLYFVQKGVKYSDATSEGTAKVDYVEIPLLGSVVLSSGPGSPAVSIFLGPTFAFEIGCKLEGSFAGATASVDCPDAGLDNRRTTDIGALAGLGVSIPMGERLSIGISGGVDFGLTKLDTSATSPSNAKNRALFGGVSVGIPIGS